MNLHQQVFRIPDGIFISLGLSWSFYGKAPADLDISAVSFNKSGKFVDVVFFNHPMTTTTPYPDFLRQQYVLSANDLPYMFLTGDSRTGGEEENRVMQLWEAERRPRDDAAALFRRHAHTDAHLGKHNRVHDKVLVSAAHVFDRLYEHEEYGRFASLASGKKEDEEMAGRSAAGGAAKVLAAASAAQRRRPLSDESVVFHMGKIPQDVEYIFICVTSYTGVDLSRLGTVRLDLFDESSQKHIGCFDIQQATGDGTANLSACLMRVPSPPPTAVTVGSTPLHTNLWDLRELNIRALGYTFVDLLPAMLSLMGIPSHSHADVLRGVPDYSLRKSRRWEGGTGTGVADVQPSSRGRSQSRSPQRSGRLPSVGAAVPRPQSSTGGQGSGEGERATLSDLRFGLGWDGEHDLDAFLVLLDEQQRFLGYVHPKYSRTLSASVRRHFGCQHSGDCRTGVGHSGDGESIDILAYALPPEAHTVLIGATLLSSHRTAANGSAPGTSVGISSSSSPLLGRPVSSIVEVPGLYLRLQNRTLDNPYAVEVDRWDVYREKARYDAATRPCGGCCSSSSSQSTSAAANKQGGAAEKVKPGPGPAGAGAEDDAAEAEEAESDAAVALRVIAECLRSEGRTLLLGALVRAGNVRVRELFPDGRSVSEALSLSPRGASPAAAGGGRGGAAVPSVVPALNGVGDELAGAGAAATGGESWLMTERQVQLLEQEEVPQFTYIPLRQLVPSRPEETSFSGVISYLQAIARLLAWQASSSSGSAPRGSSSRRRSRKAGTSPSRNIPRAPPSIAAFHRLVERAGFNRCFGVLLQFLEVVELQPVLPDEYRCHGEAWVHGAGPELAVQRVSQHGHEMFSAVTPESFYRSRKDHAGCPPNLPFKTSFLTNEEERTWGEENSRHSSACFLVHPYDVIRVGLYTRSAFGLADIDLSEHMDLLAPQSDSHAARPSPRGRGADAAEHGGRYRELTLHLHCGELPAAGAAGQSGEGAADAAAAERTTMKAVLKVRLSAISLEACRSRMQKDADRAAAAVHHHQVAKQKQFTESHREKFSWCAMM